MDAWCGRVVAICRRGGSSVPSSDGCVGFDAAALCTSASSPGCGTPPRRRYCRAPRSKRCVLAPHGVATALATGTGWCRRRLSWSLTSRSFARIRLAIVTRLSQNRPDFDDVAQMCVKPRKSNVSGFPRPRRDRSRTALRPNFRPSLGRLQGRSGRGQPAERHAAGFRLVQRDHHDRRLPHRRPPGRHHRTILRRRDRLIVHNTSNFFGSGVQTGLKSDMGRTGWSWTVTEQ
jgi:hypothetical protein